MQKNELISVSNEMCKKLLSIIDQEEVATKEKVADYLFESAQIIMNIKEEEVSEKGFAKTLFLDAYKEIATQSLSSYASSNVKIQELTKLHEETLSKCQAQHIDLPALTSKFDEIQTLMSYEVQKANEIITELTSKVKQLEEKSNLDSLTKIYNRRALSTYLNKICSNKELPYNFHLLMLDIDDFKVINDKYGHIAGDKVLIFVSNILKKTLREGDKVFRYGGEEFIIVLNRIDDKHCKLITNRLLELIRNNKLIYKNDNLSITMSAGVTNFIRGDTPNSLIARADKALYQAKKNGKNQMHGIK
ncbi:GGDEF domain-containing protein [Sulfurimonas sp.]|uniref:GGDEF domain-containing protein n=1 Tax=Sulfurimonas sp. TaxID=2022749 RepID=UPI002B4658A7|nr:GGDEF domain-containing protein [Sulfurimonas sp.]